MNEKLVKYMNAIKQFSNRFTRKQKIVSFTILGIVIAILILVVSLTSITNYAPLYSNLSPSETGQIKQTLDSKGVKNKVTDNGTTINVPKDMVNDLKVQLAAQGLPKSGHIDYSFFGKNASWGMTDNQFNVLERAAMQTELSNLISGMSGVTSSKVMINLPQKSVWVSDKPSQASVSVVLNLQPGYQLNDQQVQGLYHLISKSIPNLSENNIVIMDQMFNYYEPKNNNSKSSTLSVYQQQQNVQHDIEKNLQQKVQRMLGMMMGMNNVMVNVTTDIDFTKTKSDEQLVTPVDPKKMNGLQVSTERITETYSGNGASGVAGTGNTSVPQYPSKSGNGNGKYNRVEERVNNEFNKIHKTVQDSPYKIKDLGIQVMVEPPKANNPSSLPPQRLADIKNILNTIVRTTLSDNGGQSLTASQIAQKTVVSVEPFNGKQPVTPVTPTTGLPIWAYVVAGVAGLLIVILILMLVRRRRSSGEDAVATSPVRADTQASAKDLMAELTQDDSEERVRKRQLEKMAKEQPTEFVKLLRTWLSDES